jgi:hypothetical protein
VDKRRLSETSEQRGTLRDEDMADTVQDSVVCDRSHSLSQFSYAVYLYDPER